MALTLMDGNEAIARGAVAAGCRFFAGYPLTPATGIFHHMLDLLPPLGGVCLQGEDEIASMGYCLGASLAGLRAMTATSGPGLSLCSENISFAIGSEIPIVIVNVQRLGPSTGSATRGADGDIQFMRWGSGSGLPSITLAPVDVQDCFSLTVRAFDLAATCRCPVFIASSKEIAATRETVDPENLKPPAGTGATPAATTKALQPIGGATPVRQTSSTHGPDGYITNDPAVIARRVNRLADKILAGADRFLFFDAADEPGTDTLVVCYGVTARAAREAVQAAKAGGKPVSLLVLKTLWPVPESLLCRKAENKRRVLVVEMNLGQYVQEIRRILPNHTVDFLGQMDSCLITPRQILEELAHG